MLHVYVDTMYMHRLRVEKNVLLKYLYCINKIVQDIVWTIQNACNSLYVSAT